MTRNELINKIREARPVIQKLNDHKGTPTVVSPEEKEALVGFFKAVSEFMIDLPANR